MKIISLVFIIIIITFGSAILKTIFKYLVGVTCVNCGKRTRDFSIDRDGRTYCRQCWFNKTGRLTTI